MSVCARCRASFRCGVADGNDNEPCWCMNLPPLPKEMAVSAGVEDRCLCPQCLQKLLTACEASDHPRRPNP